VAGLKPRLVDFDQVWKELSLNTVAVLKLQSPQATPFIEDVYKICTANPPQEERLYSSLKELFTKHVLSIAQDLFTCQGDLLKRYLEHWTQFNTGSSYVARLYRYLDTHWIRKHQQEYRATQFGFAEGNLPSLCDVYPVYKLALVMWNEHVFAHLQPRLLSNLLQVITSERNDECTTEVNVASLVNSYVELGRFHDSKPLELYVTFFEEPYLKALFEYYARESTAFIASNGVVPYLGKALNRLEEEEMRAKQYLIRSSHDRVTQTCADALVAHHRERLQAECPILLEQYNEHFTVGDVSSDALLAPLFLTTDTSSTSTLDTASPPPAHLPVASPSLVPSSSSSSSSSSAASSSSSSSSTSASLDQANASSPAYMLSSDSLTSLASSPVSFHVSSVYSTVDQPTSMPQQPSSSNTTGALGVLGYLKSLFLLLSRIDRGVSPMLDELENFVRKHGMSKLNRILPTASENAATTSSASSSSSSTSASSSASSASSSSSSASTSTLRASGTEEGSDGTTTTADIDPSVYVDTLLEIHRTYGDMVERAFQNDAQFIAALDKGCRFLVNHNSVNKDKNRSAELLAKYSDVLLRGANKEYRNEDALEKRLSLVVLLFKYLDDKDVFQTFYSKFLARRLINKTSYSEDCERSMLSGLKEACGFDFIAKLQKMFNDVQNSRDLNQSFQDSLVSNQTSLPGDFSIMVLTHGMWPLTIPENGFNVPGVLLPFMQVFGSFYDTQHQGRKITWLFHLSQADVRTNYLSRKFEFTVTNYQMAVLFLFNDSSKLSLKSIMDATGLKPGELKRVLYSLLLTKLLRKNPPSRNFQLTDQLALNPGFKHARTKLNVARTMERSSTRETQVQDAQTHQQSQEYRKIVLQAAIVRIMKARKTLEHSNVIQETIQQTRKLFNPSVALIKKCIEYLIEKGYLERVSDASHSYRYLA